MQKADIIDLVTAEVYAREGEAARKAAPFIGTAAPPFVYSSDLPLIISEFIWENAHGLTPLEQVHLLFEVYADIPCYTFLFDLYVHRYQVLPSEAQALFWWYAASLLSQPDPALAEPLVYTLAVDFFEDSDQREHVWSILVTDTANQHLLQRIAEAAQAVPFHLKAQVYERLLPDPACHLTIYESLLASYYSVYGQIDKVQAQHLLSRLRLPADIKYRNEFIGALSSGERYANRVQDERVQEGQKHRRARRSGGRV